MFLTREFHEQRNLAGYGTWGYKESDVTERLTLSLLLPSTQLAVDEGLMKRVKPAAKFPQGAGQGAAVVRS